MFQISEAMLKYWNEHPEPKASDAEITLLETKIGSKLSQAYIEFMTQYGACVAAARSGAGAAPWQ